MVDECLGPRTMMANIALSKSKEKKKVEDPAENFENGI
jgi:hypothetical protein